MHIYYLPNLSYFRNLLEINDEVIFKLNDTYHRQTFRNRCEITGPNGKLTLSIPTQKLDNTNRAYKNVKISYAERWNAQHWKSFEACYRRSPYFEYYELMFKPLYETDKFEHLWELNWELLLIIKKILKVSNGWKLDIEQKIDAPEEYKSFIGESYQQVFYTKHNFVPNLSVIDLIFNKGPESIRFLTK